MPSFRHLPAEARADAPIWGHLVGLSPGQEIEVRVALDDALGQTWRSRATYRASAEGHVDLAGGRPSDAAWTGSDAYGLYWSMRREARDGASPFGFDAAFEVTTAALEPLRTRVTAHSGGGVVAEGEFERAFVFRAEREAWRGDLVADLFLPTFRERSEAVLVLGGSEGGFAWSNQVAALIAASGRAALAVAYFDWQGVYGLPRSLSEIPLDLFARALDRLADHPRVAGATPAVVGFSKGAEAALLLAAKRADIRAVVAYAPSAYVWEAARMDPSALPRSSWTWRSDPIPFATFDADPSFYESFDKTLLRSFHERAIAEGRVREARIPVEASGADVLLISGGRDSVWPSAEMSGTIAEAFGAAGRADRVAHLRFDEAGHTFLPPGTPSARMDGTPQANAYADRKS